MSAVNGIRFPIGAITANDTALRQRRVASIISETAPDRHFRGLRIDSGVERGESRLQSLSAAEHPHRLPYPALPGKRFEGEMAQGEFRPGIRVRPDLATHVP